MNKLLNNIKTIPSPLFFVAGIILFLYALGWNNEYVGHQIGGNMGDIIANLANYSRLVAIIPTLFIALIYPFVVWLKSDFKPFLFVYIGGIGGCIICLILSFMFAAFILED